jgi:hypothetical protein
MGLTENAIGRYKDLLTTVAPAVIPQLQAPALKTVIDDAGGADPGPALVQHVAANTPLTPTQARPIVAAALAAAPGPDSEAKAAAVSQAVASSLPNVDVELDEAVLLSGGVRLGFAVAFLLILVAGGIGVAGIGKEASPSEAAMVCLSVVSIISLVGTLVLVMGYKNVKLKIGS